MKDEIVKPNGGAGLTLGVEGFVSGMAFAAAQASITHLLDVHAEGKPIDRAGTEARVWEDMTAIRRGIEGPAPTPLERILAERVVVCYAALAALECQPERLPWPPRSTDGSGRSGYTAG